MFLFEKKMCMFIDDMLIDVCLCVYEVDAIIPILQIRKPRLENMAYSDHRTRCGMTRI